MMQAVEGRLRSRVECGAGASRRCAASAGGVPGILQLAEGLDFHVLTSFQPCFDSLTLGFVRLSGINGSSEDVAAILGDVAVAVQAVGLYAILHESVQELLTLGSFHIALVIKGKTKAEFLELAHAILLAESFLHGAPILHNPGEHVNAIPARKCRK